MNAKIAIWLFFRALRWLCWIGFFAYCFFVTTHRETQLDQFGHLPFAMELLMIGLGVGGMLAGFLELMMRERKGFQRPKFGQLIPPKAMPNSG
jgi:hypothetical protein